MFHLSYLIKIFFTLSLILALASFSKHTSNADNLEWSRVDIPSNGPVSKWVLAVGSDIEHLRQAPDGTLYCSANPSSTEYRLFKSADNGYAWSYTGSVKDDIVDIAILPESSNLIYYATSTQIFKSSNAAVTFEQISPNPLEGSAGREITSLDVTEDNGIVYLVVGIKATSPNFGGVYFLRDDQSSGWLDTEIGQFDVYCAAFSPDYATDKQIVAVACGDNGTLVTTNFNSSGWNMTAGDAGIENLYLQSASMAFPSDYSSNPDTGRYVQFIALDSGLGQGGVFKLTGKPAPASSILSDLGVGQDITSLAVSGDGQSADLMAGAAAGSQVYYSADSGNFWTSAEKHPSGESHTQVVLASDYELGGLAYAATSGSESAFSLSRDGGENWDQTGLIDTSISRILDLAISPEYDSDGIMFLLTGDRINSLWLSSDGGINWERALAGEDTDRIDRTTISPHFRDNQIVFLAGDSSGLPTIWKSENGGRNFLKIASIFEGAPVNIDTWAMSQDDTLLIGSYDGSYGWVYFFNGSIFTHKAEFGRLPLCSIAVSANSAEDTTILAANAAGEVFISEDGGYYVEPLMMETEEPPFSGIVSLALDPEFNSNRTIFASDDAPDKGIYRFIAGTSVNWERMADDLPSGSKIKQVAVGPSGVLYGLNSQEVETLQGKGGIERCLEPTDSLNLSFETIVSGLEDGASLQNLYLRNNTLWTIDAVHSRVLTYTDTLGNSPVLDSPVEGASGLPTHYTTLVWQPLEDAQSYQWQVDTNPDFLTPLDKFEGTSAVENVRLPALDTQTTYYWRIRAGSPILSPWSETWAFTTDSGSEISVPSLIEPKSNSLTSRQPLFRWGLSEGAARYELQVSSNDNFSNLVIDKSGEYACSSNLWACDLNLEYDTTYYWKVRAVNDLHSSLWSSVGVFTPRLDTPKLTAPGTGSSISITPNFKWTASDGAEGYELLISRNDDFSNLVINKTGNNACHTNAWSGVTLEYKTSYLWKVRANSGDHSSEWSETGIFTTKSESSSGSSGGGTTTPKPSPTPTPVPTPTPTNPAPTPANTSTSTTTSTVTSVKTTTLAPAVSAAASTTLQPQILTETPTPSVSSPPDDSGDSFIRLAFWLIGGLVILTVILLVVVIGVLKKFKKY